MIDSGLETLEQPVRALEPAVRDSGLAAKEKAVGSKPGGDPRRRGLVAALEVQAVRPFTGAEGEPIIVQHVAGPAEPLERFRSLLPGQRLIERNLGTLPVPVAQSGPTLAERIDTRHVACHVRTLRPGS